MYHGIGPFQKWKGKLPDLATFPKTAVCPDCLVSALIQKKNDFKIIRQKKYTYIHTQIQIEIDQLKIESISIHNRLHINIIQSST